MKTYKIESAGSSKIGAALAKLCAEGQIGETLVRNGCSQGAFALFVARLAHMQLVDKGKTAEQLAEIFELVSAANASAAKQALGNCNLYSEDICKTDKEGKLQPMLVETYWKSQGGGKSAPNLALLD